MADLIEHPAPRAVHALLNASQILRTLLEPLGDDDIERVLALIGGAVEDVAALQNYVEVQEANLLTMTQENLDTHRELATAKDRVRTVETAMLQLRTRFDQHVGEVAGVAAKLCVLHQDARHLKIEADTVLPAVPYSIHHHEPRTAAAGA